MTTTPVNPAPAKKKPLKKVVIIAAAIIAVILVVVMSIPTLLSTGPGRSFIVGKVNGLIAGEVVIGDIDLSWFGGQRINKLAVLGEDKTPIATVERIDIPRATLMGVALGSRDFGTITITKPDIRIEERKGKDGKTNFTLLDALQPKTPSTSPPSNEPTKLPAGLKAKLELTGGNVRYVALNHTGAEVSNLNISADATNLSSLDLKVLADLRPIAADGKPGAAGGVDVKMKVNDAVSTDHVVQPAKATLNGDVSIKNLPVAVADQFVGTEGRLVALLGPSFDGTIHAEGSADSMKATIKATTRTLTIDKVVERDAKRIAIADGGAMKVTIDQAVWDELAKISGQPATKLGKPFDIALNIKLVNLPMTEKGIDYTAAAVNLDVAISDVDIDAGAEIGRLALSGTKLSLNTDSIGQSVTSTIAARARQKDRSGEVDVNATVTKLFNADGMINMTGLSAKIGGGVKDFPVAVIDQLARVNNLSLAETLGPSLAITIKADVTPASDGKSISGPFTLNVNAERLATKLNGSISPDRIELTGDNSVNVTLPAASLQRLIAPPDARGNVDGPRVTAPVAVSLAFTKLVAPMAGGAPKLADASIDATVTIPQLALADPTFGSASISNLITTVRSESLTKGVNIAAKGDSKFGDTPGNLAASAVITKLVDDKGALQPDAIEVAADVSLNKFPTAVADAIAKRGGLIGAAIGPTVDAGLHTSVTPSAKVTGERVISFEKVIVKSDHLSITNVKGTFADATIKLDPGSDIRFVAHPRLIALLQRDPQNPNAAPATGLAAPSTISLKLKALRFPISADLSQLHVGLDGSIDQIVPTGVPGGNASQLRNVTFSVSEGDLKDPLTVNFSAEVPDAKAPGKIEIKDARITNVLADNRTIDATATITSLPVALIDSAAAQPGGPANRFSLLLGDRIESLTAVLKTDSTKAIGFNVNAKSPNLAIKDLKGGFAPGKSLKVDPNSMVTLTLTPAALEAWQTSPPTAAPSDKPAATPMKATIQQPLDLKLVVNKADIGFVPVKQGSVAPAGLAALDAANTSLDLSLTSPQGTVVKVDDAPPADIANLDASVTFEDFTKLVKVNVKSDVNKDSSRGAPVKLDVPIEVKGLRVAQDGSLDSGKAVVSMPDVKRPLTAKVPTQLLEAVINGVRRAKGSTPLQAGLMPGVLGDSSTVTVSGVYNLDPTQRSDLTIDLVSGNATVHAAPTIASETLTFREDTVAKLAVTPKLSKAFLVKYTGWLDPHSGKQPIIVKARKDGFAMPMKEFDIKRLAAVIDVDPGTLELSSESAVGKVMAFASLAGDVSKDTVTADPLSGIKKLGSMFEKEKPGEAKASYLMAEFQPFTVNVKDGVASYDPIALAVVGMKMKFKGNVDLVNNTKALSMVIPGDSLGMFKGLGLDKAFGAGKDLTIPLSGGVGDGAGDSKAVFNAFTKMLTDVGGGLLGGAGGIGNEAKGLVEGLLGGGKSEAPKPADTKAMDTKPADTKSTDTKAPATGGAPAPAPQEKSMSPFDLLDRALDREKDKKDEKKKETPARHDDGKSTTDTKKEAPKRSETAPEPSKSPTKRDDSKSGDTTKKDAAKKDDAKKDTTKKSTDGKTESTTTGGSSTTGK